MSTERGLRTGFYAHSKTRLEADVVDGTRLDLEPLPHLPDVAGADAGTFARRMFHGLRGGAVNYYHADSHLEQCVYYPT
jgi:hypothetical protein